MCKRGAPCGNRTSVPRTVSNTVWLHIHIVSVNTRLSQSDHRQTIAARMSEFASVSWETPGKENSEQPAHNNSTEDTEDVFLGDDDEAESSSKPGSSEPHKQSPSVYYNCTVSEPQKEQDGTQNAYISYLITTETNSPLFQSSVARVRRRFSDFVFLYNALLNEFPACAIPPLPDKQRMEYIKGDRFGSDFTFRRASSLNRFLFRVSRHPTLKKSRVFHTFLESTDWNAYRKRRSISGSSGVVGSSSIVLDGSGAQPSGGSSGPGILEGISDTFLNAFSKVSAPSKELVEVRERADKIEDNLLHIEKAYTRAVRRQGDIVHDLDEFAQQILKLTAIEPNLSEEFGAFARGVQAYARAELLLREHVDGDYIVSLRDMESYVGAIKALLKQREQKQLDYEALVEYLNRATNERNSLQSGGGTNFLRAKVEDIRGVDHEASRQERLRKSETKVKELTKEVESAKITSETFEEFAMNEVQIFETIKNMEMRDTLSALADHNIEFYKRVIDSWEKIQND